MAAVKARVQKVPEPLRDFGLAFIVVSLDLLIWSNLIFITPGKLESSPKIAMVAAGGINLGLLSIRRREPIKVLVLVCAASIASATLLTYRPLFSVFLALGTAASRSGGRAVQVGFLLAAAAAAAFAIDEIRTSPEVDTLPVAVFLGVNYLLFLLVAVGIGRWARSGRERVRLLNERRIEEARQAVAAERLRLARELHDIVAHAVTVMVLQAGGARRIIGSDVKRAEEALASVEEVGGRAMTELRRLLGVLRASNGEGGQEGSAALPGIGDLEQLVETVGSSGIEVGFQEIGKRRELDASVELAAFRVVQEALTNVSKHSGSGAHVSAKLEWTDESLTVEVRDDGAGSGSSSAGLSTGHGLAGLQERVTVAGGELIAEPIPGSGFLVRAKLPVAST